ncbi:MAG: hypothetical protein PHE84_03830 [bacterium]|nr:hypothetical protein [bacterium]
MATKTKKTAKTTSGKTKPSAKAGCKCPMCEQELVSQCRDTLACQPCEIKLKQCPKCGRLYQSDLKSCPTCETCR